MENLFNKVLDEAFNNAVKQTIEAAFQGRWGFNDGAHIQKMLQEEVQRLFKEDEEVKSRLKRRLIELIEKGLSDK